jgi:phosphonate transport system substrate-binding protein
MHPTPSTNGISVVGMRPLPGANIPRLGGGVFPSLLLVLLLLFATACSMVQPTTAPLGTEQNPVKLALAPTTETPKALAAIEPLTRLLAAETGLRFKLSVPTSREAVIEAMGTNNVDVGWLPPLAYLVAHERIGVEPLLANVRHGSTTASGEIVVRADSGITNLDGLRRRRFAFVGETSVNGYLMPRALLVSHGIDPDGFFAGTAFAGSSDAVLLAVTARRADGGVTAGDGASAARLTPPTQDEQLRVIARTDPVPNETLCLRQGIPPAVARQIGDGLLRLAASPAGAQVLHDLYSADGLAPVSDDAYKPLRAAVALLDIDLNAALAQRRTVTAP